MSSKAKYFEKQLSVDAISPRQHAYRMTVASFKKGSTDMSIVGGMTVKPSHEMQQKPDTTPKPRPKAKSTSSFSQDDRMETFKLVKGMSEDSRKQEPKHTAATPPPPENRREAWHNTIKELKLSPSHTQQQNKKIPTESKQNQDASVWTGQWAIRSEQLNEPQQPAVYAQVTPHNSRSNKGDPQQPAVYAQVTPHNSRSNKGEPQQPAVYAQVAPHNSRTNKAPTKPPRTEHKDNSNVSVDSSSGESLSFSDPALKDVYAVVQNVKGKAPPSELEINYSHAHSPQPSAATLTHRRLPRIPIQRDVDDTFLDEESHHVYATVSDPSPRGSPGGRVFVHPEHRDYADANGYSYARYKPESLPAKQKQAVTMATIQQPVAPPRKNSSGGGASGGSPRERQQHAGHVAEATYSTINPPGIV